MSSDPAENGAVDFDALDKLRANIFVLDASDPQNPIYLHYNTSVQALTGMALDDVRGRTVAQIYPDGNGAYAFVRHQECATTQAPVSYRFSLNTPNGPVRIRTQLDYYHPAKGTPVIFGTVQDVTENDKMNAVRGELEALGVDREGFVTMAAHDLRSPMRNLTSIIEMLREDFIDYGDGKSELLDMLEAVGTKTSLVVSEILTHAEAMTVNPETTVFDLVEICDDIALVLDPNGQHRINCQPAMINGDRIATMVALRNLLDNAIKHGGRMPLTVEVSARTTIDADRSNVTFTVRDNGRGMKEPEKLFANNRSSIRSSGYGMLGVRRLIVAREGTIAAATPDDGVGTVIEFQLPGWIESAD